MIRDDRQNCLVDPRCIPFSYCISHAGIAHMSLTAELTGAFDNLIRDLFGNLYDKMEEKK
jgi:hypothetical protein